VKSAKATVDDKGDPVRERIFKRKEHRRLACEVIGNHRQDARALCEICGYMGGGGEDSVRAIDAWRD
jgi:hypothetical protein